MTTAPDGPSGTPLVVLYRLATGLNTEIDPRGNALRADARWLVRPGTSFGFGRAPTDVDTSVSLVTPAGLADPSMPRLAGRLSWTAGRWTVTNCSTTGLRLFLTAPGLYREITRHSTAEPLPRDRQWVSLRSPDGDVEHRFHLITTWPPRPRTPPANPSDPAGVAPTTVSARAPTWPAGDARTLAAYCYPELRGLPPRPRDRTRQTLRLLERPPDRTNEKWLERQLGRLRRDAAERIGVDLRGEYSTPVFIDYVVEHRMLLRVALRAIEDRFQTRTQAPQGAVKPPG